MAAAHLSTGRVNLALLREDARRKLLECLDKCNGTKAIFWDEEIISPVGLIAEYALLKDHNVQQIFTIQPGVHQNTTAQSIIFLVKPRLVLMDIIADYVLEEDRNRGSKKEFHIFFMPRMNFLCEKKLEEKGVYGTFINKENYVLELFPVDSDLITFELGRSFKECTIENDTSSLFQVAKSLVTLQFLYGVIPNVYGKGKCAKIVFELMTRIRREQTGNEPQITPQFDNLILLDRSVDLLSPFVTQLTYEGLLDEFFGIRSNFVELPPEKFNPPDDTAPTSQKMYSDTYKVLLNSGEELYPDLRDKNFNAVGLVLSKKAKVLSSQFDERHGAKTVSEIKQFVNRLPHMQATKKSLTLHTSIAELIKERLSTEEFLESLQVEQDLISGLDTDKVNAHIEDCIGQQKPIIQVLRLLCIQSVINGGLKQKTLDYYKRELIQTYGYQHILTLQNLEKAGLLKVQGAKTYPMIKKTLRLTVDDVNEQTPSDIAYVHSGYAPLSVRLIQFLSQPGWRAITDVLSTLPGPTLEEKQKIPLGLRKRRGSGSSIQSSIEEQKVALVVFLGGCTFAEISALRFLSQQDDAQTDYIVATTNIINGNTFLKSLSETLVS